ncbi:MAG: hypothetical protein KDK70_36900 [Myxococcales bacterium]|nr:hypothetical protein [Myxococcales bacterium]
MTDLGKDLEFALQETDRCRELDSLETVVVRSFFSGRGISVPDDVQPQPNTMEAWLEWAAHSSPGA